MFLRIVFVLLPAMLFTRASAGNPSASWMDPARPFRVHVVVPAEPTMRAAMCAELHLDMAGDLVRLGLPEQIDRTSFRLVETGRNGNVKDVPVSLHGDGLVWEIPATLPGVQRTYDLYFRAGTSPSASPPVTAIRIPDYATDTYGRGWDFDHGDFESIDTFGDRPEYIRSRKAENGVLKLDVSGDAYFIWGAMWGDVGRSRRPVAIDLSRYRVLEMRIRQSVPEANWRIMGRPGRGQSLVQYDFHVSGSDWQTVRIDLRTQARWHGVLTALRIDPCKYVDAHVEIDWVRILGLVAAARSPVEVLGTQPKPARVQLSLPLPSPVAGSEQILTVRATAADGSVHAGWPIRVSLAPKSGGTIEPDGRCAALPVRGGVRALTRPDGSISVRYRASRRAGPSADQLIAVAEWSSADPVALSVSTRPGPATQYTVTPLVPTILPRGSKRLKLTAHLADQWGNPVQGGNRPVVWSAPGAKLAYAAQRTAPDGSAKALLIGDPSKRWVVEVSVRDATGLCGRSAPICVLPTGLRVKPVHTLPNGYFAAGSRAWMPLGGFYANWVGTPSPDGEWNRLISFVDATDEQIVAWLQVLKASGVTAERFMLRAHRPNGMEPMDIGGRVNPGLFAKFLHYLDLARPFGFRFQLVLHEDYTKPLYFDGEALEKFALPWYAGEDLNKLPPFRRRFIRDRRLIDDIGAKYTDPDVIACQDAYAREIVGLLKGNPLVFGYELENEMVGAPASWVNHQIAVIHAVDPSVPICVSHGGGGLFSADPAWWHAKTAIDYYTPHLYPDPPVTSPAVDYGLAVDVLMAYSRLASPAFLGESAGDQFAQHPSRDTRRWTMRDIIWFSITNGAPGCFFWNARASEIAEFRLANAIASRIDWTTFRRRPAATIVSVPHPLTDDQWFNTADGRKAYAAMAQYAQEALDRGAEIAFALGSPAGKQSLDAPRFEAPSSMGSDFHVSSGFQLKPLVRADGSEALLYVRNFAGVERWDSPGTPRTTQYLRKRAAAPLTITTILPGRFTADVWDLDTGVHSSRTVSAGQALELGTTDHDFAVLLKRR